MAQPATAKREQPEDLVKSSAVHDELSDTNALALLTLEVKYDAGEFKNRFHDPYAFGAALLASFGGFHLAMVGSLSYSAATTQTAAQSYATIVASRSIGGIGVGTLAMGAPFYISEISPPAWRGSFWVLEAISIVTGAIGMERYRFQQALLKREYHDYARHPLLGWSMSVRSLEEFQLCWISIGLTAYTDHLRRDSHGNPASGDGGDNKLVQSRVGYTSGSWVVLCGTDLLYVLSYSVSYGPLALVLPAEVFSSSKRAKGVGAATGRIWLANFIIGVVVPEMLLKLGLGTYLFCGLFCVAATEFSFLFVPGTTNKSLEQVAAVFGDGFVDEERNLQSRIAPEVWHGSSHAEKEARV
ncbi:hypothetical protein AnigIFM63309_010669 [Aspergillus niger]|nr:hypothetical protein AnigIFM63309_010669 [Aspergillus niger]